MMVGDDKGYFARYGKKLYDLGYTDILPIAPGKKYPSGIDEWESVVVDREGVEGWARNGKGSWGVGLRTRDFPGVDLDIEDSDVSKYMAAWCLEHIGAAPQRIGRAPRRALLYRTREPFTKLKSPLYTDWEGREHRVEILGDGQQMVLFHIHPDTGKPYKWRDGGVKDLPADDLTEISRDQALSIIEEFKRVAEEQGWVLEADASGGGDTDPDLSDDEAFLANLKTKIGWSLDDAREALSALDPTEYDAWTEAGFALYHEFDGSTEAYELWDEWSQGADSYGGTEHRWKTFKDTPGQSVKTARTLIHRVKAARAKAGVDAADRHTHQGEPKIEPLAFSKEYETNAVLFLDTYRYLRHRRQSYFYEGRYWEKVTDEEFASHLQKAAMGGGVSMATVNSTLKTAERLSVRQHFQPDPTRVAFNNGVLNLADWDLPGFDPSLEDHDHENNVTSLLDFDYDPGAGCPLWVSFLDEVFQGEAGLVALLQEWMGYCLVWDYRHQKMMLMVGKSRSGKGTIASGVMSRLYRGSYAGLSLSSMASDRGLVPLAGCRVGVVGDAHRVERNRIERAKECLLNVTGQDSVHLDPKYKDAYSARIPARLTLLANEMPRFFDPNDALANRHLVLPFQVSFAGREDPRLEDKLCAELPGIFNWAVRGLVRLGERKQFTDCDASRRAREEIQARNNPVGGFLRQYCALGPGGRVGKEELYQAYERYCDNHDHRAVTKAKFGREVAALDGVATQRELGGRDKHRAKAWGGIAFDSDKFEAEEGRDFGGEWG